MHLFVVGLGSKRMVGARGCVEPADRHYACSSRCICYRSISIFAGAPSGKGVSLLVALVILSDDLLIPVLLIASRQPCIVGPMASE